MRFQWTKREPDTAPTFECRGNLDFDAQEHFHALIREAERLSPKSLSLDFRDVHVLDSAGLGLLLLLNDRLNHLRGNIQLVGLRGDLRSILDLMHFGRYFKLD